MADLRAITAETVIINLNDYDERVLARCLRAIAEAFENYMPAQDDFIREFPRFAEKRLPNIEYLNKVSDELDKHHKNCNIATVVGASVGILGGIIGIAGAGLLTVATGGAAAPLIALVAAPIAAAGGVTATLGGVTSLGSYVTGFAIEKGKGENVKTLLEEDSAYFKKVFPWIQRTSEMEKAVEEIMNFNVFQGLMLAFNNDPDAADAMRRGHPMHELPQGVKNFIDDLPIAKDQKQRLKELIVTIIRSLSCSYWFRKILCFFEKHGIFILKAYRVIDGLLRLFRVTDATVDIGTAVANIVKTRRPAARLAGVFGVLSAISVAIDIWVLVSTSKDMAAGSKSELAGRIRKCTEGMQTELNALEQIYCALT